ncbi:MAG: DUF4493 domain-containing protein [Bacteroidaceae bacterium]|nr:DUF4493 domain-containing protein [Bacteroidaceae bacterium]
MKKFFMCAMAAVAMLSVSSCLSEEEVNFTRGQEKNVGYISLNATTENAVVTRAITTDPQTGVTSYTGTDLNTWYARVYTGSTYKWGESGFTLINNAELSQVGLDASQTWTVSVRNYPSQDDAHAANADGTTPAMKYGAPYYEFTKSDVAITAGSVPTPVTVACGAPKNSKLTVVKDGFTGTDLVIYITSPRAVTFTDGGSSFNNDGVAYFPAGDVQFYISYKFGGVTKRWPLEAATPNYSTLALTAGKAKTLTITSNSNGTITLTITTAGFADDTPTSVTFDAVTGDISA